MRWHLLLLIPLVVGCSRKPVETTEPATDDDAEERTERTHTKKRQSAALLQWMQESQRQALVGQDLAAFMRIWGHDARLISCRSAEPGPYDEVIPIERIEAFWKGRGLDGRGHIDLTFSKERVRFKGNRATVTWETTVKETHKVTNEVATRVERESWLLRRRGEKWEVVENRVWPISIQRGKDPVQIFDAAEYRRLDEEVERAKTANDVDALLPALFRAQRHGEGHDAAVRATAGGYPSESRWFWRAAFAVSLYFIDDARTAFREQLALNDSANVPSWARPPASAAEPPTAPAPSAPAAPP